MSDYPTLDDLRLPTKCIEDYTADELKKLWLAKSKGQRLQAKLLSPIRKDFCKTLIYYRKTRGLSQTSLANLCKIHPQTILRYEKGINFPSPAHMAILEEVLNLPEGLAGQGHNLPRPVKDVEYPGEVAFGQGITHCRKVLNLSRSDLSAKTGGLVTVTELSNYERGKTSPRFAKRMALVKAFGFTSSDQISTDYQLPKKSI